MSMSDESGTGGQVNTGVGGLDRKISELPLVKEVLLDDIIPIVHAGVTSHVALRTLISELNLSIPQPRIKISAVRAKESQGHDMVFASWDGSNDNFLKYNPQFWLYRYRKADYTTHFDKRFGQSDSQWRKKRFVHPSHMHGFKYISTGLQLAVNEQIRRISSLASEKSAVTNLYSGQQLVLIDGVKTPLPYRQTEWKVATTPYTETTLLIEPWKYFRVKGQNGAETMGRNDFPTREQPMPKGTGTKSARMVVFKVRIAIDNPDRDPKQPKLFGPFSETFIFYPHKIGDFYTSLKCFLGEEASPMLRRHPSSRKKKALDNNTK
jgi:hypothetical protein